MPYEGQKFPVDYFNQSAFAWMPRWLTTGPASAAALAEAIRRIGACHIMAHSSGSPPLFRALETLSTDAPKIHSITLLEPGGVPEVDLPKDIPILSVWGDFIEDHPLWMGLRKQVRDTLSIVAPDAVEPNLNRVGLRAHSHQFMQDNGNDAVLHAICKCVQGLGNLLELRLRSLQT